MTQLDWDKPQRSRWPVLQLDIDWNGSNFQLVPVGETIWSFLCARLLFLSHFWLVCSRKAVRNSCSYMLRLFDFGTWRWFYWRWKSTHKQRMKHPIPRQSCNGRKEWKVSISSLFRVSSEVNDPDFSDFKWLFSASLPEAWCWGRSGRIQPQVFCMFRLIRSGFVKLHTEHSLKSDQCPGLQTCKAAAQSLGFLCLYFWAQFCNSRLVLRFYS